MAAKLPVLVVEDEAFIRSGICDVLAYHGYAPVGVEDGASGLAEARSGRYALVVLDIMLPELDGFSVCRELRKTDGRIGVLMLTAKGSEQDVLEGFEAGADDYVTKPFSVAQLVARVGALARRASTAAPRSFRVGDVEVDADRQTASVGTRSASLTPRDLELLSYLAAASGRAVAREELLREVWGYARVERVETRCIDMHVAKLRRKLGGLTDAAIIHTVRGAGYRLDGP